MIKIWEIYPKLTALVLHDHLILKMDGTGHPFDHTLSVAQVAANIVLDPIVAHLAGAAGLCHNADRLLQKKMNAGKANSADHVEAKMIPRADTNALLKKWISESGEFYIDTDQIEEPHEANAILYAVMNHSGPNLDASDDIHETLQNNVLIALQDADRIVCSMASVIMDAAQFWSALPSIDPKWLTNDPDAHSYRNPKSVLKNLECRYDWINLADTKFCVRLPKAQELMQEFVAFYRHYIAVIKSQRAHIGLWPDYPVTEANA